MRTVLLLSFCLAACNVGDVLAGGERWELVQLDGEDVAGEYLVTVAEGRIIGGFDGCADWSFKTETSPVVVGDGESCAPDATRDAYWDVVNARRGDGEWSSSTVQLEAGARAAIFARR